MSKIHKFHNLHARIGHIWDTDKHDGSEIIVAEVDPHGFMGDLQTRQEVAEFLASAPALQARVAELEEEVAMLRRGWKELAEAPHPRKGMRQSLGGLIARVSEILEGKTDARTELDYGSGYAFTLREMHRNLKEVWNRRGEPGIVTEFGTLYCLDTEEPAQEVEDPDDED